MDIRSSLIQDSPKVIGNHIYGTVIPTQPNTALTSKLCCLNPKWSKGEHCEQWSGVAAKWLGELSTTGKKGTPHLVEIDGKRYVVKAVPLNSPFTKYRSSDVFNLKNLRESMKKYPQAASACLGMLEVDYQYIGMDDFATEVIVSSIVNAAFKNSLDLKTTYVNSIVTQTICGNYGLILSPLADYRDVYHFGKSVDTLPEKYVSTVELPALPGEFGASSEMPVIRTTAINPDITYAIIKQVVCTLDLLSTKVEFIHSDLKVTNVLLTSEPSTGKYKNVDLRAPLSIKIADFANCSVSLPSKDPLNPRPIRFYNENRVTRIIPGGFGSYQLKPKTAQNCFSVEFGTPGSGSTGKCTSGLWWKLPSSFSTKMSLITAHSGMPFYRSYDLYTFMVSLMMVPSYYSSIMSDPRIKGRVWDSLWRNEDLISVTRKVRKMQSSSAPTLDKVIEVLSKYEMKCSAIVDLLQMF